MRYRSFGRAGWQVSEIGFGAWQIGGEWGNVDDADSIDTLLYAYEKGINFVDTAELYGKGRSEEVIGKSLKAWRDGRIYVATKAQPIRWPNPDLDHPEMRGRYPNWYLRESVEDSLRRLGVERIDLFQLHCWLADGVRTLDWLETLNALRIEGKAAHARAKGPLRSLLLDPRRGGDAVCAERAKGFHGHSRYEEPPRSRYEYRLFGRCHVSGGACRRAASARVAKELLQMTMGHSQV